MAPTHFVDHSSTCSFVLVQVLQEILDGLRPSDRNVFQAAKSTIMLPSRAGTRGTGDAQADIKNWDSLESINFSRAFLFHPFSLDLFLLVQLSLGCGNFHLHCSWIYLRPKNLPLHNMGFRRALSLQLLALLSLGGLTSADASANSTANSINVGQYCVSSPTYSPLGLGLGSSMFSAAFLRLP